MTSLAWLNVGRNRKYSSRNEIKNEEGHTSPSKTRLDNDDDEKEEEEDYPFFTCSLDKTIKFYRKFTPVATLTEHAGQYRLSYKLESQSHQSTHFTSEKRVKRD